ncbi:MAG TPA: NADH-ubiquinone oxidoreductase-F iron-sulfur binding region domain-containing protein [Bacteroidales bacterium]|nr:NADH-ubiquinone oxidoreductase-F iron-sulfur binding region domain-containing protein [Bacteroidales bacterium]HOG65956.1 NADH-ubiquinone oxidoreductase-F iron-sulfur binding region domain-containing protein [Bacteroidales bacterium]
MIQKGQDTGLTGYLIEKVLKNYSGDYPPDVKREIDLLLRRHLRRPVIYVGTGTCGIAAGADATLKAAKEYLKINQLEADLIEVGCVGLCSAEPLLDYQAPGRARVSFQHVTADKVYEILEECFHNHISDEHVLGQVASEGHELWHGIPLIQENPFFKKQHRILLYDCGEISPTNLDEYIARDGYKAFLKVLMNYPPEEVCNIVGQSGLKGRGGGGFPTATKWNNARLMASDKKFVICNADESDPGAYMDRALVESNPYRLIEGISIAAYAVGASKAYIYIRSEYNLAVKRLQNSLIRAKEAGFLGENIFNSGFNLQIILRQGPGAFVCGEETALIKSIEGHRGTPETKPPFPFEKGLFGKPTVVNNVETLINVPLILLHGPLWFKSIGTETSTGTKLFALTGDTVNTGLVEVPFGITLEEIIYEIGGGIKNGASLKAIQIGGPSGSLVPAAHSDLQIDYEAFHKRHQIIGSGGMVVMDENTCILDMIKYFINFLQKESCGKCIPCREGTNRMYEILQMITTRPKQNDKHESLTRFQGVIQLENLAKVIKETSLCGLGKTAPNPVLSALEWFREEFEEHVFERKCRANVCKNLIEYVISAERCTGCMVCMKKCPYDAITGAPLEPHLIIRDKCTSCGICYEVCKFSAIDFI